MDVSCAEACISFILGTPKKKNNAKSRQMVSMCTDAYFICYWMPVGGLLI